MKTGKSGKKYTSMSFRTALGLSANNLRTKKGRTIMTAFAGSIGIIGIALILALSSGVNDYIQSIQEDTLSEYPLQITSSELDLTSLLASMSSVSMTDGGTVADGSEGEISVTKVITSMFSQINANDLGALKTYLESGQSDIYSYVKAIEYDYGVKPLIYLPQDDGYRQVNPDTSMSSSSSILSSFASMGVSSFYRMPETEELYIDQYEVKAGHWPESYNECVLVLSSTGSVSDYLLYTLGLREYNELEAMIAQYNDGESVTSVDDIGSYTYDDVLGITYKVVCSADLYAYDSEYEIFVDKSDNAAYVNELAAAGEDLTIVGVVQPKESSIGSSLTSGINYPMSLIYHLSQQAASSDAVLAQLADPDTNIFTGEPFGADAEDFDLASLLNVDEDALSDVFDVDDLFSGIDLDFSGMDFDASDLELDFSDLDMDLSAFSFDLSSLELDLSAIDWSGIDLELPELECPSLEDVLTDQDLLDALESITINTDALSDLARDLLDGYQAWLDGNGSDPALDFAAYLQTDGAKDVISGVLNNDTYTTVTVDEAGLASAIESAMGSNTVDSSAVASAVIKYIDDLGGNEIVPSDLVSVIADAIDQNTSGGGSADAVAAAAADYIATYAEVSITDDGIQALVDGLLSGYYGGVQASFTSYLQTSSAQQLLSQGLEEVFDLSDVQTLLSGAAGLYLEELMESYSTAVQDAIQTQLQDAVEQVLAQILEQVGQQLADQMSSAMESMMQALMAQIAQQLAGSLESMMSDVMGQLLDQMADSFSDAFSFDADSIAEAFDFNMDSTSLMDMLSSMSLSVSASYDSNLSTLGYADFDQPSEIDIYPLDFESKEQVVAILDDYNARMEESGQTEKKITYTDLVATMMSSVTTIVNTVSYVLIAFIAVSLLVSCIMISIITQISVMERTKEIGILRAMGASKGNISQVFNAETFIIGACSGLIGVGVTELLIFPINAVIHSLTGDTSVNAVLPWNYALILVAISIVITVCSGLVPALNAAKQDPVKALRTE